MQVDWSDVDHWALQLNLAAADVLPGALGVVAKGSLNIKTDARQRANFHSTAKLYPGTITYDTRVTKTAAIGETGPRTDRPQGPLGHLLEFGSPTSAPRPHLNPAGDAEEPRFVEAMEALAARLLEGR